MSTNTGGPAAFGRTFVEQFQERDVTFIAASLAYYAFVSLVPLLLLAVVIASTVDGQDLANRITSQLGSSLPSAVSQLLTNVLSRSPGTGGAALAGVVALLWSALKLFRGLDIGFAKAYDRPSPNGLGEQLKDEMITFIAVILGVGITIAVGAIISAVSIQFMVAGVDLFGLLASLVSILALSIPLFPLYYFLPADDVSIKEAIPGQFSPPSAGSSCKRSSGSTPRTRANTRSTASSVPFCYWLRSSISLASYCYWECS